VGGGRVKEHNDVNVPRLFSGHFYIFFGAASICTYLVNNITTTRGSQPPAESRHDAISWLVVTKEILGKWGCYAHAYIALFGSFISLRQNGAQGTRRKTITTTNRFQKDRTKCFEGRSVTVFNSYHGYDTQYG
jgi:hypothetical protein